MGIHGKAVRLVDVAAAAGVSRTAAAKVLLGSGGDHVRLGPETAGRVREAARRLGYRPNRAAQQLRGAPTHTIGVLMDTVNAPVMNDRLAAIERAAVGRGYRVLVGQVRGDDRLLQEYLGDFESRRVEGLICLFDLISGAEERLAAHFSGRRHVVFHGRVPAGSSAACVRVDTAAAIDMLVEHLLARGCRRIALELCNRNDLLMEARLQAYRQSLTRHGLPFEDALVWTEPDAAQQPPDFAVARAAVEGLVGSGRAAAIIASNDLWASRLVQVLKAGGREVPGDVAVTGYDNLLLGTVVSPSLTTVDQRHDAYAEAALDLILRERTGGRGASPGGVVTIAPRLVVRESA